MLSNTSPHASEQVLKKQAGAAWRSAWHCFGQDCVLCGAADAQHGLVCVPCQVSLPRPPESCMRCAAPLASDGTCGRCARSPPAFDAALAAFEYRFPVNRLVQRFKFHGDFALGRWLARAACRLIEPSALADLLCVPPMGDARLRERGFNQAAELARVIGDELRIPVAPAALRRVRAAGSQTRLDARARHANLRGAFDCARSLAGMHVAVVDDVMTTGATANEMARALRSAGAARVSVWVVARTP